MADGAGQAQIRGYKLDRVARQYNEEANIFYNEVTVRPQSGREIRWYQETQGYLTLSTGATIKIAEGAQPFAVETTWTRNTSYPKKYMLDGKMIHMEDEKDAEVRVFLDNMRKVVEAIAYDRDLDIWDVASESQSPSNINSVTSTAAWDAASGQDPMEDVSEALQLIREQTKRAVRNPKLYVSAKGEKDLKVWITGQGTKFTEVASDLVMKGMIQRFAGCEVVVSEAVTADYAGVGDLKRAVEYFEFIPMTTDIIRESGIGRKVRVWTHGVPVLTLPKFFALISNTEL